MCCLYWQRWETWANPVQWELIDQDSSLRGLCSARRGGVLRRYIQSDARALAHIYRKAEKRREREVLVRCQDCQVAAGE